MQLVKSSKKNLESQCCPRAIVSKFSVRARLGRGRALPGTALSPKLVRARPELSHSALSPSRSPVPRCWGLCTILDCRGSGLSGVGRLSATATSALIHSLHSAAAALCTILKSASELQLPSADPLQLSLSLFQILKCKINPNLKSSKEKGKGYNSTECYIYISSHWFDSSIF